jgi:uncharacterized protein YegP (UPF0339 family)
MAKFQLKKAANGEFHFTLTGSDDQSLLQSEMYKTKSSAENGIESVKKNAADDGRYDRKKATNGKDYYVLKAGNGQVIGQSRMFDNGGAMEAAIGAVKSGAAGAAVDDQAG